MKMNGQNITHTLVSINDEIYMAKRTSYPHSITKHHNQVPI